jgi:hypothetical protein
MTRLINTTVDRLRVCVDGDGYVGVLPQRAGAADEVILTLGKTERNGSGWHAYPMDGDGTLWTTPCYLRSRKSAIRYMAALTAWADHVDTSLIR